MSKTTEFHLGVFELIEKDELCRRISDMLADLPKGLSIEDEGVVLKNNGCNTTEKVAYNPSNNTLENILRLMKEIPALFQKNKPEKKYWNTNSRSGKNKIEEWRKYKGESDPYCPHGEFIIAMLVLGYEYREKYEKRYPEMTFNATYRNLMKYTCTCGLEYTKATEGQHKSSQVHKTIMRRIARDQEKKDDMCLSLQS
jgi:hypothetical protein